MPATRRAAKPANVVDVVLANQTPKKHSVRFEVTEDVKGPAITNVYLSMEAFTRLGNPDAVKVTIEAFTPE